MKGWRSIGALTEALATRAFRRRWSPSASWGGTCLRLIAHCPPAAGEQAWVVERVRNGLLVRDAATGTALGLFATMQGALAVLWEAVTSPVN